MKTLANIPTNEEIMKVTEETADDLAKFCILITFKTGCKITDLKDKMEKIPELDIPREVKAQILDTKPNTIAMRITRNFHYFLDNATGNYPNKIKKRYLINRYLKTKYFSELREKLKVRSGDLIEWLNKNKLPNHKGSQHAIINRKREIGYKLNRLTKIFRRKQAESHKIGC